MYTQENVNVDLLGSNFLLLAVLASWGSTQLPSTQHTAFWMLRVLASLAVSMSHRCGEVSISICSQELTVNFFWELGEGNPLEFI